VRSHFGAYQDFLFGASAHNSRMNTPNSTAPAAVDTKLVGELVDASRDKAMEKAGESEARVSAIQDIQKEEVKQLLGGADGNTSGAEQLIAAAEQEIADEHAERMTTIKDTPDAYVFERTDATAGVQHDDTREVGLADDVLMNPENAKKVSAHEGEHLKQDAGHQTAAIPETGDKQIDGQNGGFSRRMFRENGAVKAEGGLRNHTQEYHDWVKTAAATAKYLNEEGADGDRLVKAAGETNAGFAELTQTLATVAIRKRIREQVKVSPQAVAA
jgi:hypothetical protein